MWNEIKTETELLNFMEKMHFFHDSCIKEIKYLSGAFVDDDLAMSPINKCRVLSIIIQRQYEENSMIELEFGELKHLKLFPLDTNYTCEIHECAMFFQDGYIFWTDCEEGSKNTPRDFCGTVVCASKVRWRAIKNAMGEEAFFYSRA